MTFVYDLNMFDPHFDSLDSCLLPVSKYYIIFVYSLTFAPWFE